jgi:hypothetical protein
MSVKYVVVMRSSVGRDVVYKAGRRRGGWTRDRRRAAHYSDAYSAVKNAMTVGGYCPVEVRDNAGETIWASLDSRESADGMILRDGAWVEWEGTERTRNN